MHYDPFMHYKQQWIMIYMKIKSTIFYLSGTGNTLQVALWMAETMTRKGTSTTTRAIEQARPDEELSSTAEYLGIGMPTHGFTLPWAMLKFLLRLPRGKNKKAFVFATRAGAKYGPIPGYPPGIAGSSIFIASLVLALKGYRVQGMMSLNMPSNWMSLHTGLRADIVETIHKRSRPRAEAFIEKILEGKRILINGNIIYEFIWALALAPISAGYLFLGRFFLAKLFFANHNCTGCGICAANCPTGSIAMYGKNSPRPYWSLTCESCMRCMGFCPNKAIEAGHSWGALLYYVLMEIPVSLVLLHLFLKHYPILTEISKLLQWLIFIIYYFTCLIAGYYMFWLLIKIPVVNRFFTYTTFTHIYRRYHSPDISLKSFKE